ncbi:MAG: hypothetical protein ACOY46_07970 [Bacillota bacterium]
MARVKIDDLPQQVMSLDKNEMTKILGGVTSEDLTNRFVTNEDLQRFVTSEDLTNLGIFQGTKLIKL